MKKIIISILFLGVISGGIYWFYFKKEEPKPLNYRTEKIVRGNIEQLVTATGTLNAVQTVQVGTQVSGTINKLLVDYNDNVKAGQVIAQIEPTFLEAQVKDAKANLQKTSAQLNESKRNFRRVKSLLQKNLSSQQEYDAALAQYEISEATRKQSEAQLERAVINLKYATIKSPIDGVIISRQVDVGQTVAASFASPTLFSIANDLTKMQVQTSVDEADIGKVKIGQKVYFTVDAYPETKFTGTVRQVRLASNIIQNVVTYTVIIDVPNDEKKLMPGMTATVSILIEEKINSLKISSLALKYEPSPEEIDTQFTKQKINFNQTGSNGNSHNQKIWILTKNNKLKPVEIKVGISDGTSTEIIDGEVSENEIIVLGVLKDKEQKSVNPFIPTQRQSQQPRTRN